MIGAPSGPAAGTKEGAVGSLPVSTRARRRTGIVVALAACLLPLAVGAGRAAAEDGSGAGSLAGQLLVATPEINDPRFVRTVIYMIHHDAGGAVGLVVNRPIGHAPLARLLQDLGLDATGAQGEIRVHYGGPVERTRGFVLHTDEYAGKGTRRVNGRIAFTTEPDIFRDIAGGTGPRRLLFELGYAGWGPRQLETEIEAGHWVTVPSDEGLVFDEDYEQKWERAMARRTIRL
jgi:putative transcriptional regulator